MGEAEILLNAMGDDAPSYAVAVVGVMVLIRFFRHPLVQKLMPSVAKWENLPMMARRLIVGLMSGATTWVTALATGQGPKSALTAMVPVAVAAVFGHKITKAAGHAQTQAALRKKGGGYRPNSLRTAISPVFPIDHKSIAAKLEEA